MTLEPLASCLPPSLFRSPGQGEDLKEDYVTVVIKIMAPSLIPSTPI